MKKKILSVLLAATLVVSLFAGCGKSKKDNIIKVGASPTPHAEILKVIEDKLKDKGYTLEIVEYNDYILPNNATENGELDANYFQHQPYLENFNEENGTHLVSVASVHFEPFGIYAGKTDDLKNLKEGASVAVPNDTTNEARALLLLEAEGLIKLKDGAGITATKNDVVENPLNLDIKELEAAQIPRAVKDVDIACINGNYAAEAGYKVSDALATESAESLAAKTYANVLVVKEGNENSEKIKALKEAETSIGSLFRNLTNEGPYNDYQVTTNLTHDIYAGYMANTSAGFHEKACTYVYTDDWSKNRWDHFYNDRTANEYAQIIKVCHFVNKDKYWNEFYVTRIYYAFLISMQTDTYGDIPLSYYIKGMLPPTQYISYTSQKDVYDAMFKLLDEAITNIKPDKGLNWGEGKGSNDRCYGGDINKWLRFANTLRLRLALRISNVDPDRAQEEGKKAIESTYGLMQSNADNMRTVPKVAPIDKGGEGGGGSENIHALIFGWGAQMVMSKDCLLYTSDAADEL